MHKLYIDCETKSPVPVNLGTRAYSQGAGLLIVTYALDDEPVKAWQPGMLECIPKELPEMAADPDIKLVAHKSEFDRTLLLAALNRPPLDKWICTMTQAYAHALPASLDMLCRYLGLPPDQQKMARGKELIQMFCVPPFAVPADNPIDWADFVEYGKQDISAMRHCEKLMPSVNYPDRKSEYDLWVLDQKINDRGFAVDTQMAEQAVEVLRVEKLRLDAKISELTGGVLRTGNQREKLKDYLEFIEGVGLPNMQKSTLNEVKGDLTDDALTMINIRLDVSRASTAKYQKLLDANVDGRIYGASQFCGADRTGRWAGRVFQPLNLPRPQQDADLIYLEIELLKAGEPSLFYDSAYDRCADALRGTIVAGPGKKLVVVDWSAIEGVLLAWEAGETDVLDAYRAGVDQYIRTYKRAYGVTEDIVKKDPRRQVGKVLDLSGGYQGGMGAIISMAKNNKVDYVELAEGAWAAADAEIAAGAHWMLDWRTENGLTMDEPDHVILGLEAAKGMWRRARPRTVSLWKELENAAVSAMTHKGKAYKAGKCSFLYTGSMLAIRLPSGRLLLYAKPRLRQPEGERISVSYLDSRGGRRALYGGLIAENITQANSREILARAMLSVEPAGFPIVLHVYDEIVAELDEDSALTHGDMSKIMCVPPPWGSDIPLAAEGFTTKRYRKE